ncbi:MAG TPA: SusD/RagB family nutrient-binding outer membrane lipoprotein [Flavobacteriales bacterium]|jgi:hypothetical protein|nr:SusD/RagB family nutrient-binding outer membrane lipoprotein [Flavobacteriales bacterium]HIB78022.1 SusD/RagB family nutrient-binding outer membrane lipoprotein [Flavobacteriales bacterium]HIN41021.1 SusD/RagB family nutrient-binding outer membrane lipoprotein [Flavobacteriales bacterium]HIO16238.1 SusD/RagB family nutrient-binding outer membrane lipoprotein [Flavobacteriales bacterium]HIO60019.1 SusD/RagB family nutrient-binding outer membrane lipoprotein [Flavobacteriales bacterium]
MKMNKNIFILMGLIGAISITGCTKDFGDLNTNPNEPTSVSTGFLLTNAQKSIMDRNYNSFWGSRRAIQMSQYWSSNQYSNESRYQFRTETGNAAWSSYYAGALENLQNIIDQNTNSPEDVAGFGANENQIAVATILQVWVYQQLTDAFGAIPMTDALQGSDNTTPAYDSQSSVYASLLSMLNASISGMDASAMGPLGDQIYGGDMSAWAAFANSLKLRVAMRMADVDGATAQAAAEAAAAAGCITDNGGNALFAYLSGAPNNNPINESAKTRTDFAASNTMIDHMTATNDPRMSIYYSANSDGVFIGEVYGLDETNAALTTDESVSQLGATVLAADFPGIYMDAAQVNFLLAEGAARGWSMGGTDADYYASGVAANMAFWGVDETAAADFATANTYDATDWKTSIGTAKWVALYMQGHEAWAELRRLDAPTLNACADGQLDGGDGIPTRMMYPLDEQTLNNAAWSAGVASNGGVDDQHSNLWWDVN